MEQAGVLICVGYLSFAGVQRSIQTLGNAMNFRSASTRWLVWKTLDCEGESVRRKWFGNHHDRLICPKADVQFTGIIGFLRLVGWLRRLPESVFNRITLRRRQCRCDTSWRLYLQGNMPSAHSITRTTRPRTGGRTGLGFILHFAYPSRVVVTTPFLGGSRDEMVRPGSYYRYSSRRSNSSRSQPTSLSEEVKRSCRCIPSRLFGTNVEREGSTDSLQAVMEANAAGRNVYLAAAGSSGPDEAELREHMRRSLGDRGKFLASWRIITTCSVLSTSLPCRPTRKGSA